MQGAVGDGFTQAVEFCAGPLLFGFLGWLLDRAVGTEPLFLIAFAAFGVVGAFATFYVRYQAECARNDEGKPWARHLR